MRFDTVAVIHLAHEAVREMHAVPRNRARECAMQIGSMEGVVGRAESGLDQFPKRRTEQDATVIPASLLECRRFDADPLQHCLQSEAMQDARSVGANIDAGTDLSEGRCLLVNPHVESCPQ